MSRELISGFDYRSQQPVRKTRKQWRAEVKSALDAGGKRRVENGETFISIPVTENLGAPFGKVATQVLAIEIYSNVPA